MAKPDSSSPVSSGDTVTLDLTSFLMPGALFLSALVLAGGLFFGLNNIASAIKAGGTVAGTNTTTGTTTTNTTNTDGTASAVTQDQVKSLFNGSYLTFGDSNRPLLFVEFSDPSCPYCHIAGGKNGELNKQAGSRFTLVQDGGTYVAPVEEMKKLVDEGKASFAWVYTNGHGNGELSTKAMYCAYEQGKFWEVHDKLMSAEGYDKVNNEIKNDKANITKAVDFLKDVIDANFLRSCLESGKYDGRIASDQSVASAFGVSGTPGFFVNTTMFPGAYSFTDMQSAVNSALGQ
jgi:protein-disulfide isomerase